MSGLKSKVVRGFAWNVAERVASMLFQLYVMIKVTNRITPEDRGIFAIMIAILAVFNTLVDSGFSHALVQKSNPSEKDYSSAFYFNIAIGLAVYALLVGLSYPAAALFGAPVITVFAPVLYLSVPLASLSIIQQAVFTRNMDFKRLSLINFVSYAASGIVALIVVLNGYGLWALVWQRVSQLAIRAALMWSFGRWRLRTGFSADSIRGMYGFGSRIFVTDFVNNLYNQIPQFVIGRYHKGTLGHFDMAKRLRDQFVVSAMNSMQAVTFPALSKLKDDEAGFPRSVGRVVASMAFLMFPMMAGLIAVIQDFFSLFLAPDWQGAVPFFQILCLTGFMVPVTVIATNVMKARGEGDAVMKAEIIKKVFATAVLIATIPFGAVPIAWGQVAIAFTDMVVGFGRSSRRSGYGLRQLARDTLPALALTAVMLAAVLGVGYLADGMELWLRFTLKVLMGVAVYFGGAAMLRLDAFGEFMEVVRKIRGIN